MVSPPQNWLYMVFFIIPLIGRCSANAILVHVMPICVSVGEPIEENKNFAWLNSLLFLYLNAISVLSNWGTIIVVEVAKVRGLMIRMKL
jgi:hypothetical protein